jgi:hypothetical protein
MGARQARRAGKKGVKDIGRYVYRPIDSHAIFLSMSTPKKAAPDRLDVSYRSQFDALRRRLGQVGWISEGYVQNRGPGAGGPCYQWTRKVKGKTVSVALSREQFEWLKEAIAQWRQLQATLKEMQQLSRRVLFQTVPHPPRRKRLAKRVLGIK